MLYAFDNVRFGLKLRRGPVLPEIGMALRNTLSRLRQDSPQHVDPQARLAKWRGAVRDLYQLVQRNLEEYIRNGLLVVQMNRIERSEDFIGGYEIDELHLIAGPAVVVFSPIGTYIVGAAGRVDIYRRGYADNRYLLLWKGTHTSAPGWKIAHKSKPSAAKPYTKVQIEAILDELLQQK